MEHRKLYKCYKVRECWPILENTVMKRAEENQITWTLTQSQIKYDIAANVKPSAYASSRAGRQ